MNLPTTRLRVRRMWWLIAVAVSPLACSDPLSRFTYGVKLQIEPLPPGVNPDPTQFRGQVAARGGPGASHVHMRLGKCPTPCLVEVTIAPVGDTREVNPASPLIPASGRVVAKILNLDTLY